MLAFDMISPVHHMLDTVLREHTVDTMRPGFRLPREQQPLVVDEEENRYRIAITAPGIAKKDLSITMLDGRLTVRGETKDGAQSHVVNYSVALPADAHADKATAEAVDGILTVNLPKKAPIVPARIAITVSIDETTDEEADTYQLSVVAPGVAAGDLDIVAEGNTLQVRGETKKTGARLARSFRLPRDADTEHTSATHVDGILTLKVPKKPAAEATQIVVGACHEPMDQEAAAIEQHVMV